MQSLLHRCRLQHLGGGRRQSRSHCCKRFYRSNQPCKPRRSPVGRARLLGRTLLECRCRLDVSIAYPIDVGRPTGSGVHGTSSNQTSLDQLVRITPHDFSIFTSSRFSFIGIDNQVSWSGGYQQPSPPHPSTSMIYNLPAILLPSWLVHETPLQSTRESSTSSSSQSRFLNLVDQPRISLQQDLLGLVPISPTLSSLQSVIMLHV